VLFTDFQLATGLYTSMTSPALTCNSFRFLLSRLITAM